MEKKKKYEEQRIQEGVIRRKRLKRNMRKGKTVKEKECKEQIASKDGIIIRKRWNRRKA